MRRHGGQDREAHADYPESGAYAELAQACLDSAVFMSRTGYMAINSMILSNNMCLLKSAFPRSAMARLRLMHYRAWMFSAGLLLGFSMFLNQGAPVPEVDNAFQNSISVLERLAQVSPQARHYFDILGTFADAIQLRREQAERERQQKGNRLVNQIFTVDLCSNENPSNNNLEVAGATNATAQSIPYRPEPDQNEGAYATGASFDFDTVTRNVTAFDAWADIPFLSDNLYIDWESTWPITD